ncbi:tetratricopeptide repeat protein [Roseateles sp. DAIF2]|uniref:tetratricopeptide repeat protein n=1 Tax=Roseateles sp. DAIF2 TaxID=2714952 RepID=UPI0018A25BE0|nr:tetratricopeptide repeat protein [Roseateles sp. DAIF2]QPF73306.1 tetratricopeptide repeat protein [Roseateles sp. DAIF2]
MHISALFALLITTAALAGPAVAKDLDQAQALWLQGKRSQALEAVRQGLADNPNDARLRFAQAVMQMELGRTAEAEAGLVALTQDFPDLADPFNNLAVLYAARGALDPAREALEQAVRLQPDHVQAQENLGDVLLRLAARAYGQALRLSSGDTTALQLKLRHTEALIARAAPAKR